MFNLSSLENKLSRNLINELSTYLETPKYKLLDWVDQNIEKMDISSMAGDYKCHHILIKHQDRLDENALFRLCQNTLITDPMISALEKNIDKFSPRCWEAVCNNARLLTIVQKNIQMINRDSFWRMLSQNTNPQVILILTENQDKSMLFDWYAICKNHLKMGYQTNLSVALVESNIQHLTISCWRILSNNPTAIHILEKNQHMKEWFDWKSISKNGWTLVLLQANRELICWEKLALNPNSRVLELIEKELIENPDNINSWVWSRLCSNTNPDFINFISHHIEKLGQDCWYYLSKNPSAIPLLLLNRDKINWGVLYENPGI